MLCELPRKTAHFIIVSVVVLLSECESRLCYRDERHIERATATDSDRQCKCHPDEIRIIVQCTENHQNGIKYFNCVGDIFPSYSRTVRYNFTFEHLRRPCIGYGI